MKLSCGKIVPKAVAPSGASLGSAVEIDEFAFYTRAHGRGTGGGRAFGRGAYGPAMRGRTILPKE